MLNFLLIKLINLKRTLKMIKSIINGFLSVYHFTIFTSLIFLPFLGVSQQISSTVRGEVIDKEFQFPLPGATIALYDGDQLIGGTSSDAAGLYLIKDVPVGRYTLQVSFIGYQRQTIPNVIVKSGKELVLNLEIQESAIAMQEFEVKASKRDETVNDMALISARQFTIDETDRYAGSRGEPARMASNFAGVQGADDSRNDIVIRGNSPLGLLWRMEGINIPNPNHFGITGTTGGPVSIINNKVLSNSDFFTGAFPAEYGNAIAGVFDLRMRNGNNQNHEFTGQFGLLGTEITAEGPLSKSKGSSYLVNYRYSTVSLFQILGIDIGTAATPVYQDATFRLNFPQKNGGTIALFGVGGLSNIEIIQSTQKAPTREIFASGGGRRDEYFWSGMGVTGLTYTKPINKTTYFKAIVGLQRQMQRADHDLIYRRVNPLDSTYILDSLKHKLGYRFFEDKITASFFINKRISARHILKIGMNNDIMHVNMVDTNRNDVTGKFINRVDANEFTALLMPYIQWKYIINDKMVMSTGLNAQYFAYNNSSSIEPRVALNYNLKPNTNLSFGAGLHSQLLPTYLYYHHIPNGSGGKVRHNKDLDFVRSAHFVAGVNQNFGSATRLKIETYYQYLFDIPVEAMPSGYSVLNQGSGFERFFPANLVNEGTGQNYGVEFTFEKFFAKQYFFLTTLSLFESKYQTLTGQTYDSDFNGNFVFNFLSGKEWVFGREKNQSFNAGVKLTWAGARRYTPIDTAASRLAGETILIDSLRNTQQFRDYFRFDTRIAYKLNTKRLTHEIGIDLINMLPIRMVNNPDVPGEQQLKIGTENVLKETYTGGTPPIITENQLGFFPIFYYKIDF